MQRSVAIKKLGALLGKRLGYRVDDRAPTPDERAAAREELKAGLEHRNELMRKRDARYKAILDADQEYQSLVAAYRAARDRAEKLSGIAGHYKITVGISESMFFLVKAQGDSWENVIRKIEAEKKAA